jgi:imidazolonepropionase-like amidohydrolase
MTSTLVIRNGTLIDGTGAPPAANDSVVIHDNRIVSVGALPPDVQPADVKNVSVIDAAGQWIMPGLIDAHCHLSYGYPFLRGEGRGRGAMRPELNTLRAAWSASKVLRAGVTSISVPGGTWFTDVGVRDAVKFGLFEGPRIHCAGRMIITYGSIEDDDPEWVETPDHSIGILCNSADAMVAEVRRQAKRGVNFIKLADSRSGLEQTIAKHEIQAVVEEAHRRNIRVAIHSRGSASTRAAAEAGVDWIVHADLATERDLEAIAEAGCPVIPTATFLARVAEGGPGISAETVQLDIARMKRHFEALVKIIQRARSLGIRLLIGTDTGNNTFTPFGERHTQELEIFVKYGGYTPLEAITIATRDNAFAMGLEGELGTVQAGKLADLIVLDRDPVADIGALAAGKHLVHVIKDGKRVDRSDRTAAEQLIRFRQAAE